MHEPPARDGRAVADRNLKRPHHRPHDGEIFLILGHLARQDDVAAAVGTRRWQRRLVGLIKVGGGSAMRPTTVGGAGLASRAAWRPPRDASRKWRGLSMQRASGVIDVVLEPLDLLSEHVTLLSIAIPVSVRALMLTSQPLNLEALPFDFLDQLFARRRAPRASHASLMPRLDREYKRKPLRSRRSQGGSEVTTR